jgi:hypothetical protein
MEAPPFSLGILEADWNISILRNNGNNPLNDEF